VVVLVLTISDRAYKGIYRDASGASIEEALRSFDGSWVLEREIVADDGARIRDSLIAAQCRLVDVAITTGGTGLGPRDITPEITRKLCGRSLPGIAEMLRRESCKETVNAVLSRGEAGVMGTMLVVNLPGSPRAAAFGARLLSPILSHAVAMIRGEGHGHEASPVKGQSLSAG
jgi:molybdopterin adenylyltransferase